MGSFEEQICGFIYSELTKAGLQPALAALTEKIIITVALAIAIYLTDQISRRLILSLVKWWANKRNKVYEDIFVERRVFKHIAHIAPALVAKFGASVLFNTHNGWIIFFEHIINIYIIFAFVFFVQSIIQGGKAILAENPDFNDKPIGSYSQLLNIINYFFAALFIVSEISGQSMWALLTAAGALSAVMLLVFKDTITGLVASIQISSNDMIRIGDSIEVPKYGADGEVIEINLTTIKVRNGDNTITTIPTFAPITDSFKNWRGMEESAGRRIKRAVHIKIMSVNFLQNDTIQLLGSNPVIAPILEKFGPLPNNPLSSYSQATNLSLFREYLVEYLKKHPKINPKMVCTVRQLNPTDKGLPIEIYCFTKEKEWVKYENVVSDIFEHIIAALPYFNLEIHESPSATKTIL